MDVCVRLPRTAAPHGGRLGGRTDGRVRLPRMAAPYSRLLADPCVRHDTCMRPPKTAASRGGCHGGRHGERIRPPQTVACVRKGRPYPLAVTLADLCVRHRQLLATPRTAAPHGGRCGGQMHPLRLVACGGHGRPYSLANACICHERSCVSTLNSRTSWRTHASAMDGCVGPL